MVAWTTYGEELLEAPQSILGADTLQGVIELSWTDTLTNETAWHVDRSVPPADWINDYALLPAGSTYFADSNLWGSAVHYYRVRPSNAHQSPTTTRELHLGSTRPNIPRNVQATVILRRFDEYTPTAVGANGDSLADGKRHQGDVSGAAGDDGGGDPIWLPTNAIRLSFEGPLNQAVAPTSYIVRAWPEGVYCTNGPLDPCPTPPDSGNVMYSPSPAYEWYELPAPGAFNVCLARKSWQYQVGVFARGFDGQWSLMTPITSVSTGRQNFYDCDGGTVPQASVLHQALGNPESILDQNFPNPFNASTTIRFTVSEPGQTSLVIYNILGQRVRTLFDGFLPGGTHEATWDGADDRGRDVASGIYLYRFQTGSFSISKRMSIIR